MSGFPEFRRTYARLTALCDLGKAIFMADPLPTLLEAKKQMHEMHMVLERVYVALSPAPVLEMAEELCVRPMDFQGEALVRCDAAKKVVRDYMAGRHLPAAPKRG